MFSDLTHEIILRFCFEVLDVDPETQLEQAIEVEPPRLVDGRIPYFTDDGPEDLETLQA